jgi:hypothetical protein
MKCSHCGSNDCRKVSAIYVQETAVSGSRGIVSTHGSFSEKDNDGVWVSGANGSRGWSSSESFSFTLLADYLAPPEEPDVENKIFSFLLLSAIVIGVLIYNELSEMILFLAFCLCIALMMLIFNRNESLYEEKIADYDLEHEIWDGSWYCYKCGNLSGPHWPVTGK